MIRIGIRFLTTLQYGLMLNTRMYVSTSKWSDAKVDPSQPEHELGGFDKSLLDQFDDCLAAIHHLSKGKPAKMQQRNVH
jgi:hypothetical protein